MEVLTEHKINPEINSSVDRQPIYINDKEENEIVSNRGLTKLEARIDVIENFLQNKVGKFIDAFQKNYQSQMLSSQYNGMGISDRSIVVRKYQSLLSREETLSLGPCFENHLQTKTPELISYNCSVTETESGRILVSVTIYNYPGGQLAETSSKLSISFVANDIPNPLNRDLRKEFQLISMCYPT